MKMVKSLFLGLALSAGLLLGGCSSIANLVSGAPLTVQSVKDAAVADCGFLPTGATVAGILTASPYLLTAEAVAGAICQAIAPVKAAMKAGRKGYAPVYVNGVQVHGTFK